MKWEGLLFNVLGFAMLFVNLLLGLMVKESANAGEQYLHLHCNGIVSCYKHKEFVLYSLCNLQ